MRWRDIENRCAELTKWYTDLAAQCGETAEGLIQLRAQVDNHPNSTSTAESAPSHALRLTDGQRDLAALAWWVTWLVNAYDLSERWPACWYRHEGLVATLRALRRWHRALGNELAADPKAATDWHDALARTVDGNIAPVTQRCLTTHRASERVAPVSQTELATALAEGAAR